jgi:hypothetical protein
MFLSILNKERNNMAFYQLCPKCNGQGIVSKPPWVPAEQQKWSSSSVHHVCDVCLGAKILLVPESKGNTITL